MFELLAATEVASGLTTEAIIATLVYALIGIALLIVTIIFVNIVFRLNLHKELVEEHNVAFGVLIAGLAVGISVIVAGTITS